MRAIRYALIQFDLPTDFCSSGNSTVVAFVSKQGGTRLFTLTEETYLLFHLLQRKMVSQSKLSPGDQEIDSGLPVHTEPNPPIRKVSPPIHCPENSENLGLPSVGSVCHQKEQKTNPVVSPVMDIQA